MGTPILYTFRRCPYAMRARMALKYARVGVEVREIDLKRKPAQMIKISPKATVPVLKLSDETVLDESLDIMRWALAQHDPLGIGSSGEVEQGNQLIATNDGQFKMLLDRYKYPSRYGGEIDLDTARERAVEIQLKPLNERLCRFSYLLGNRPALADLAIMPFIRQFAMVDPNWFANTPYAALRSWLETWIQSELFTDIMRKFAVWEEGAQVVLL